MSLISQGILDQATSLNSLVKEAAEIRVAAIEAITGSGVEMEKAASVLPEEKLLGPSDVQFLAELLTKVAEHVESLENENSQLSATNQELRTKIDNTSLALNKQAEFSESENALIQAGLSTEVLGQIPSSLLEKFASVATSPEQLGSVSSHEASASDPLVDFLLS